MAATLVNGQAYDYTKVVFSILGVPLPSLTQINYTQEQDKENNMGASNKPVSRGHGSINSSGSIEISMTDMEALREVAPERSLLLIPSFDVVVTFFNTGNVVRNHVLQFVEFKTDGMNGATGDTDLKMTLDLVIADILYS